LQTARPTPNGFTQKPFRHPFRHLPEQEAEFTALAHERALAADVKELHGHLPLLCRDGKWAEPASNKEIGIPSLPVLAFAARVKLRPFNNTKNKFNVNSSPTPSPKSTLFEIVVKISVMSSPTFEGLLSSFSK
jgi:hypothetical protein